ncbi:unnamed protein product [Candidula unifasciata]|uniref:Uncharacterized protein n=1 Tax=Candidula unifasciata TaxID=100452 RepID=A0A8S3YKL4_9EUPU|nr:unnamed protein product [Candidula unifasciata]
MSGKGSFELRKPVSPYICSTPLDFNKERQFLSDVVFPKLNDLCKSRGAYFNPVDLRWKPADAKTEEGLLLKTSLNAITHCVPFFLCLLGETYGPFRDDSAARLLLPQYAGQLDIPRDLDWLDKNLVLAASGGHSWVLQEGNQYKSITELEVTQAVLLTQSPHATLYYRRSDHLDSHLVPTVENKQEAKTDLSLYSSESEQAKGKIHYLKQRLVNRGVSVKYFSTVEELEKLVLEDWAEIIDLCLPPLLHDVQLLDTVEYKEWMDQEVFLNRDVELFVSTPDVEETLEQLTVFALTCTRETASVRRDHEISRSPAWSKDGHDVWALYKHKTGQTSESRNISVVLFDGDRGAGKSALVGRWFHEFKKDNPDICLISHAVSASRRSSDIIHFLKYCTRKLRQRFLLSETYDANSLCAAIENDTDNADDSLLLVSEAFVAAISLGPCVILLDGQLPTTCRVIFVSTSSDISHHCLSRRPDTLVLNLPVSLKRPSTTVAMIQKHFPTLSDLIGEKALTRLAQLKLMQTALGAKMIGCELLLFSGYSNLNAFMEEYAEVWSLRDFWTICVQNWTKEYSWTSKDAPRELSFIDGGFCYSGWVIDSLSLILLSRNGLTQDQILSILKMIGYDGDLEVTNYDYLKFKLAASASLQEVGDGCLIFGHRYIQNIAEYILFGSFESSSHDPAHIIRTASISRRQLYHTYLARYFSQQLLNVQILQELPWHLMFSGDILSLVNCLTNWNFLLKVVTSDSTFWLQDLKIYWSVCQVKGYHPDLEYLKLIEEAGVVDVTDVQVVEDKYNQSGMMTSRERTSTPILLFTRLHHKEEIHQTREELQADVCACDVADKATNRKFSDSVFVTQCHSGLCDQQPLVTIRREVEGLSDVAFLGWFLAKFLDQINEREAGKIILSSLMKYIQQKCSQTTETHILLSRYHHFVGQCYETFSDLDTADKKYKLALRSIMAAIDLDDEMICEESTQYLKGLLLNCLGHIRILKGQNSEAAELLEEALDCIRDNSDCFVLKSAIYYNLGLVCSCQHNYIQAETHLRESVRLRIRWFGWRHPLVAEALVALAQLLAEPSNTRGQDLVQAKDLYKQALHIQQKCFGPSHLSVASVLYELGSLLAAEDSRLAKLEAQDCLRQSLDLRVTHLGSRHPFTIESQQKLTQVNVDLQLKNYEFGSGKYAASSSALVRCDISSMMPARANRKPFSAVSLPESGQVRRSKKGQRFHSAYSEDNTSEWSPNNGGLKRESTLLSMTSASERLLSTPLTGIPRLLYMKKHGHSCQGFRQHGNTGIKQMEEAEIKISKNENDSRVVTENELSQSETGVAVNLRSIDEGQHGSMQDYTAENIDEEINQAVNGNFHNIQPVTVDIHHTGDNNVSKETGQKMLSNPNLNAHTEITGAQSLDNEKKTISVHPASSPQRLLQRYRKYSLIDRPQTNTSKSRKTSSFPHRLWSGRSSITAASLYNSSHLSHCKIPGRYDITVGNSRSMSGPHSDLTSLLGDPPCPRQTSNVLNHRSAWYHVPGRYATPQHRYPSKRMQRTKSSKDIEFTVTQKWQHPISKQQEQEDLRNQSEKENLVLNGTYLLHSRNAMISNKDNFSMLPRFVFSQNSGESLKVSGLEMPRGGHPNHGSASQSRAVQFQKNNILA